MKLLGSTENKINKGKHGENPSHLKLMMECQSIVTLLTMIIVNSDYQKDSNVSYRFIKKKNHLVNCQKFRPNFFLKKKPFNSKLFYIDVQFTDEDLKPLEI